MWKRQEIQALLRQKSVGAARRLKHKIETEKDVKCMQIDEIKAQLPALQSMLKEAGESL